MPVSGFSTVVDHSSSTVPSMATPSNCSSPSPTNSLPHPQQNGQLMEVDCMSLSSKVSSAEQMISDNELMDDFSNHLSISPKPTIELKDHEKSELSTCLGMFERWSLNRQTEFVEQLISRMSFHQHEHIYSILIPMLQRDFITALPGMFCYSKFDESWMF